MSRVQRVVSLLLLSAVFGIPRPAAAQSPPSGGSDQQEIPSFLLPPPREMLRKGLRPLSDDLPDVRVREGLMPPDASQGVFDAHVEQPSTFRGDQWAPIQYHWAASELRHRPLYFEDAMLERHGQTRHRWLQPAASGARFFATFPVLPYALTVEAPCTARAELGRFRPGSGAPLLLQRPPLQVDAGLWEAGAWIGLIFLFP